MAGDKNGRYEAPRKLQRGMGSLELEVEIFGVGTIKLKCANLTLGCEELGFRKGLLMGTTWLMVEDDGWNGKVVFAAVAFIAKMLDRFCGSLRPPALANFYLTDE